jgi:hypothetical protein
MPTETVNVFLLGAIVMASGIAALFFLKFWRQTQDRFFSFSLRPSPLMPSRGSS